MNSHLSADSNIVSKNSRSTLDLMEETFYEAEESDAYNLSGKPCYVLVIHNQKFKNPSFRGGSEEDLSYLKEFCKSYRMQPLDICEDKSVLELKKKMAEIKQMNFDGFSGLLVVIMSHGYINDQIFASDDVYNLEEYIVDPIVKNRTLKGKPKLFFIQAFKGADEMYADGGKKMKRKSDIIKCFSTYEEPILWTDTLKEYNFIQLLLMHIAKYENYDISTIMCLLRKCFHNASVPQLPTDASTLLKKFYFGHLKLSLTNIE